MSEDVEVLINTPDDEYRKPEVPPAVESVIAQSLAPPGVQFGTTDFKTRYFMLDPAWTFLNHGAFGAACRAAYNASEQWRLYSELQPLRYADRVLLPSLVDAIRQLAVFIEASPLQVVPLPHVTAGLNAAICGLAARRLSRGDKVLGLDCPMYGTVKKLLTTTCDNVGAELHLIPIAPPVTDVNRIMDDVEAALRAGGVTVALFEHISSTTGLVFPVVELAALCKRYGVGLVIVDGAHGPLSVPLSMKELEAAGVDVYCANLHKWVSCPKGAAFLWSTQGCIPDLHPAITSHGQGKGFLSEFIWDGNRDYTAFLSVPAALRFWESLGGPDRVRSYTHTLCRRVAEELAGRWGTTVLAPLSMSGPMVCVEVPATYGGAGSSKSSTDAVRLQNALYNNNVEVPVKCLGQRLWIRLSAHVYNHSSEYSALGDVVDRLVSAESRQESRL